MFRQLQSSESGHSDSSEWPLPLDEVLLAAGQIYRGDLPGVEPRPCRQDVSHVQVKVQRRVHRWIQVGDQASRVKFVF